jgi:hypothetical protein
MKTVNLRERSVCTAAALIVLFSALPSIRAQSIASSTASPRCEVAGQLDGWSPMDRSLTVKTDAADYREFVFDDSTVFLLADGVGHAAVGSISVRPDELAVGDRVCVQSTHNGSPKVAARVLVTFRSETRSRDQSELVNWQNRSLFGTVVAVDPEAHNMRLQLPTGGVTVEGAPNVQLWTFPRGNEELGKAKRGTWGRIAPGDRVYVRGDRRSGTQTIRASLIVMGGFRSYVGAVGSVDILHELVSIRDFESGNLQPVHLNLMELYLAGGTHPPENPPGRGLFRGSVTDVREGDSVLIFGRQDEQGKPIEGYLLVTGFSPGGVTRPGAGQSPDWIFQAIGLGAVGP